MPYENSNVQPGLPEGGEPGELVENIGSGRGSWVAEPGSDGNVLTASGGVWTSAAPASGGASVGVNNQTVISSGEIALAIPQQPLVPNSGILQPLPPIGSLIPNNTSANFALAGSIAFGICTGPDGNLWVADSTTGNGVWKITKNGTATKYALAGATLNGICVGSDGNLWVADGNAKVWKVTTSGTGTSHALAGAIAQAICSGPDGNLWVGDSGAAIWKVTTSGSPTKYTLTGADVVGICAGPDGNLWVADGSGVVWKVTTGGVPTSYILSSAAPTGICVGSDGNLWVADGNGSVWKVTTAGTSIQYLSTGTFLGTICSGPDGNLWVGDESSSAILRISTSGVELGNYTLAGSTPDGLCTGPDGNLWVADGNGLGVWVSYLDYQTPLLETSGITLNPGGHIVMQGSTSGSVTLETNAAAGSSVVCTFPAVNNNPVRPLSSGTSHEWVKYIDSTGLQNLTQPASTDLSDVSSLATSGANSNITSLTGLTVPLSSAITNGNQPQTIPGPVINANGYIQNFPLPTYSVPGNISYYVPTTSNSGPSSVVAGPDGFIYFTEQNSNKIGKLNPSTGAVVEFSCPTSNSNPNGICVGADGKIYYSEGTGSHVVKMTTSGSFTTLSVSGSPQSVCTGPDGNVYYSNNSSTAVIGKITPSGAVTNYTSTANTIYSICTGPDGCIYGAAYTSNQIVKMTTSGVFTYFTIPTSNSHPIGICTGPDGNIWFCESTNGNGQITRMTTSGVFTEYPGITSGSGPSAICSASDGCLWFVGGAPGNGQIGRMTTSGVLTSFTVANNSTSYLSGICHSADGNIWIADYGNGNNGLVDVVQLINTSGGRGYSGPIITLAGSTSGTLQYSMPEQGASYKKFIIQTNSYIDTGETITFPVAFVNTPSVTANTTALTISTITTTAITIPTSAGSTGVITVEGF